MSGAAPAADAADAGAASGAAADASDLRSFRRLIWGESISSFGVQLSLIAVPTYAVLHLDARPVEISAINMMQWAPPLLVGLFAGRVADRLDRRRTMVIADLFAAAASLWLAWLMWTGSLGFAQIYLLVFAIAVSGTFYTLGSAALVPRLLMKGARGKGNSHLAAAQSLSHGGAQLVSARIIEVAAGALVVLLDAVTYLVRAALVSSIAPEDEGSRSSNSARAGEPKGSAWAVVRANPALVRLIGAQGTYNIGASFILAFFYIYAVRVLGLGPFHIGVMLALGHVAGFAAAMALPYFLRNRDLVGLSAGALAVSTGALWLIVGAMWLPAFAALLLYQALFAAASVVFTVAVTTERQNLTPIEHQGRVASFAILFGYACLLGGGALAAAASPLLDVRTGIVTGCLLSSATILWFALPAIASARLAAHGE